MRSLVKIGVFAAAIAASTVAVPTVEAACTHWRGSCTVNCKVGAWECRGFRNKILNGGEGNPDSIIDNNVPAGTACATQWNWSWLALDCTVQAGNCAAPQFLGKGCR